MTVKDFLSYYQITPNSLEEIKKRVFVVGKFNTAETDTAAYLFSKRRRSDARYKASMVLGYEQFIDVLQPTLTEFYREAEIAIGEVIPYFDLAPQEGSDAGNKNNSSYVIDPYNYFFQRAVNTSEHDHYKANKGTTLKLPEYTAGETIYKEIRANLKRFCAFQQKNYDLIRAFAQLLDDNKGTRTGIPNSYSDGQVFPVKFLPVFIDYLYKEGTEPFSLKEVDFASQSLWQTAASGMQKEAFNETFPKLVRAFKNYLIDPGGIDKENIGGLKLDKLPKYVPEKLRLDFVDSRDSYNMLKQIVRSKVLLSMVLQWAISSFYELDSVKKAVSKLDKSRAIEKAIREGTDGLAPLSQQVPEGNSVANLIADFKKHFPTILEYVKDPNSAEAKKTFSELSEFLQNVGKNILKDEGKTANIRLVLSMHPEQRRAVLQALENFFVDVLIPRMFKEPGLTPDELKRRFSRYEEILFQQSNLMDVANTDNLQNIDAKQNETYEETLGRVLDKMVEILVQDKVVEGFIKTAQTVENQSILRRLLPAAPSIGKMVPLLSPVDNMNTDAYSDSIKLPVADEIVSQMELEREETIDKIKALPQLSGGAQIKSLTAGEQTGKLLQAGESEPAEEANESSNKALELLKEQVTKRLSEKGNINLALALHSYANASKNDRLPMVAEIKNIVKNDVKVYHYNLSRVYHKYAEPMALPQFKNLVEAMTLCQLLLVNEEKLHLDKAGTNLYDLLLDLIEFIDDPDKPNLKKFFSQHSLSKYISVKHFNHDGQGFAALESILKNQADESLKNVQQYVSELQGIKYLFDVLDKSKVDCEVVVVNAYCDEFTDWVINNIDNERMNFFNPGGLVKNNTTQPQFPVAIFMTELSFNKNGYENTFMEKENFLKQLGKKFGLLGKANGNENVSIMPPVCISTSIADEAKEWISQGKRLNQLCKDLFSPVLILGPSLPMNRKDDARFATILSSGYIFCTHLLTNENNQLVDLKHINGASHERFRVIGYGAMGVSTTMKNLVEAPGANFDYAYAADFYLYIISLLAAAAQYSGAPQDLNKLKISGLHFWQAFYNFFNYYASFQNTHGDSRDLDRVSLFKSMPYWSLSNDVSSGQPLQHVNLFVNETKKDFLQFGNIEWFNNLAGVLKTYKDQKSNPPVAADAAGV